MMLRWVAAILYFTIPHQEDKNMRWCSSLTSYCVKIPFRKKSKNSIYLFVGGDVGVCKSIYRASGSSQANYF